MQFLLFEVSVGVVSHTSDTSPGPGSGVRLECIWSSDVMATLIFRLALYTNHENFPTQYQFS